MNVDRSDRIELRELRLALHAGRWHLIAITVVFALAATIYAVLQPNVYQSEVVLAPAITDEVKGLSGLAGQLGSLASLAGITLGSSSTDKTTLGLEVLQSRAFINDFVRRRGLLVPLMAARSWDITGGEWVIDDDLYDQRARKWVRRVSPPRRPEPSEQEVFKVFTHDVLAVARDEKSGVVRVRLRSLSPIAAQQWLTGLIADLNQYMRAMDIADAQRSIEFLQKEIDGTSVAEMQAVFYGLIEQQTRTMMLAQVREDYVFKTVDPAVVPDEKASPMRALICVVGAIVGLFLGSLFVLVRHFSRNSQLDS
jgi:uncharacterized protein involved in exopolysaccharide biosynthesis